MEITKKIRDKASETGKTIEEIEKEANLSPRTIRRWDEHSPSIDKVYRVANVLGCTVDDLISASERIGAEADARMEPEPKTGSEIGKEIREELRKPQPAAAYFRSVAE